MQEDSGRHKTQLQISHSKINMETVVFSSLSWPANKLMTMGDLHLTKNSETMEMRQLVCKLHWKVSEKSNVAEFPK